MTVNSEIMPGKPWLRILTGLWHDRTLRWLFVLALALRLLFFYESMHQIDFQDMALISSDSHWYLKTAEGLMDPSQSFEKGLFTFGPGFAGILSIGLTLWGRSYPPFILVNILVSALSIPLVYLLASWLTQDRRTAIAAGLLAATSYTSITLSLPILSDTTFFMLFGLGLVLLLRALATCSVWDSTLTGVIVGVSILVRAVAQFWPLVMGLIALKIVLRAPSSICATRTITRRRLLYCASLSVLISLIPMSLWMARNQAVHGVTAVTLSGVQGFSKTVALAVSQDTKVPYREVIAGWIEQYQANDTDSLISLGDQYRAMKAGALSSFQKKPGLVVSFIAKQIWTNITAISYFHRSLIPDYNSTTIAWEGQIKRHRLNLINVFLSSIGLLILMIRKQYLAITVVLSVYMYFGILGAFTPFQGSRIFYPAQYAWAILVATALIWLAEAAGSGWRYIHFRLVRKQKLSLRT